MIITEDVKQQLYEKTAGICIICEKTIAKNTAIWSVEHFIPRAIYKWLPTESKLRRHLESYANLFIVHTACNNLKDSIIPTVKQIRELKVTPAVKTETLALYYKVELNIRQYQILKQRIWSRQHCQCQSCHKIISLNASTLRRINNQQARTQDNAMCVCFGCSIKMGKERNKNRKTSYIRNFS